MNGAATGCCGHHRSCSWWPVTDRSLTVLLYVVVPKGFFPQQDTGIIIGITDAVPGHFLQRDVRTAGADGAKIVLADPGGGHDGLVHRGGRRQFHVNNGRMFITLKPLGQRKVSADQVITRLRRKLAASPGITLVPAGRRRTSAWAAA